jgi:sec-independent protein translocase protein TatA
VGPIGVPELIFLFVLALLIFGPRKLPELGRSLGKAMTEFRRASTDLRMTVEEEMREIDRQTRQIADTARDAVLPPDGGYGHSAAASEPAMDAPAPAAEEKPADGHNRPA